MNFLPSSPTEGHTGKINAIDVMNTENCFLTCSDDRTVQLWSLSDSYKHSVAASERLLSATSATSSSAPSGRATPTGSPAVAARLVYAEHRKPVLGATYLSNYRLVASIGGQLILWDPCTGQKVSLRFENNNSSLNSRFVLVT